MTASEKINKSSKEVPVLPGAFLLLKETFSLYLMQFRFFFGYAAWLLVPIVISVLARVSLDQETVEIVDLLFNVTLYVVLSIFVTVIFIKSIPLLRKKKSVPINVTKTAIILTIPYLVTSILVGFSIFGGFLLLIIPGIIFSIWFAFATTIVVIEQTRVTEALQLSRNLVKDRFWSVLWRYYFGHAIILAAYGGILLGILYISFTISDGTNFEEFLTAGPSLAEDIMMRLIDMIFLPVGTIYTTLLYLHLRASE